MFANNATINLQIFPTQLWPEWLACQNLQRANGNLKVASHNLQSKQSK